MCVCLFEEEAFLKGRDLEPLHYCGLLQLFSTEKHIILIILKSQKRTLSPKL